MTPATKAAEQRLEFRIELERRIEAPIEDVFEELIEQLGPGFVGEDGATRIRFAHEALGLIPDEVREGVDEGWADVLDRMERALA